MRLMGTEKLGNRTEKTYFDNGKVIVATTEDAEPVLDANKRAYNDAPSSWKGDFHRVASIPVTVIEDTCTRKGIPYREFVQAKSDRAIKAWNELLNAREFRFFRTRPGRVDVRHGT